VIIWGGCEDAVGRADWSRVGLGRGGKGGGAERLEDSPRLGRKEEMGAARLDLLAVGLGPRWRGSDAAAER
jgi:hypothetical protein